MKKRWFALLLSMVMLLSLMPVTALADNEPTLTVSWTVEDANGNPAEVPEGDVYVKNYTQNVTLTNPQPLTAADGEVYQGDKLVSLAAIAPTGYQFLGWYLDGAGDETRNYGYNPPSVNDYRSIEYVFGDESQSVTARFLKLEPVTVNFRLGEDASVIYRIDNRNFGTDDAYTQIPAVEDAVTTGAMQFYPGDHVTLTASIAAGSTRSFKGFYLEHGEADPTLASANVTYEFTVGTDIHDGDYIDVQTSAGGYSTILGYTTPEGLTVETADDYGWRVTAGGYLASGNQGEAYNNTVSLLKVTADEAGYLLFDYKISTKEGQGWLLYKKGESFSDYKGTDNNANKKYYCGEVDWTTGAIPVAKDDVIYFGYYKMEAGGSDTVWLRNLRYTNASTATVTVTSSEGGTGYVNNAASAEVGVGTEASFTVSVADNSRFYGWVIEKEGERDVFVSGRTAFTMPIYEATTLHAVFGKFGDYEARIDGDYFGKLSDAVAAAQAGDLVAITDDAELTADLDIPANVTLLVPYDDDDDYVDDGNVSGDKEDEFEGVDLSGVGGAEEGGANLLIGMGVRHRIYGNFLALEGKGLTTSSITQQGAGYHTLTVKNNATLTVKNNARLVIGGVYSGSSARIAGQVAGSHGEILLEEGSTLAVEPDGILSCQGYISGAGQLDVQGTVYENFIVTDYYGGGNFLADMRASPRIFPFKSYLVMGVQSHMILHDTAHLWGYCSLPVANYHMNLPAEVVGGETALIHLGENCWIDTYYSDNPTMNVMNGNKVVGQVGTTMIEVHGDAEVGSLTLNVPGLGQVDTGSLECPLPYSIQIKQAEGNLTLTSNLVIMPGCVLEIGDDAKLTVAEGASLNALTAGVDLLMGTSTDSHLNDVARTYTAQTNPDANYHSNYPTTMELAATQNYLPLGGIILKGEIEVEKGGTFGKPFTFTNDEGNTRNYSPLIIAVGDAKITTDDDSNIRAVTADLPASLSNMSPVIMMGAAMQMAGNDPSILQVENIEPGITYTYDDSGNLSKSKYEVLWTIEYDEDENHVEYTCDRTMVDSGETTVAIDTVPTRDGYTFIGWYLEGEEGPFDFENTPITGDITLVAHWVEVPEVSLTEANFINRAGSTNPATIEVTDAATGAFTVTCDKACAVIVKDGDTYTRIRPTGNTGNTYNFTQAPADGLEITVAIVGDLNGDGAADAKDATQILRVDVGLRTVTELESVIGDINGDGVVDAKDATQALRLDVGLRTEEQTWNW